MNGKERRDLESYLADDLFKGSVHFCKWENVVNKDEITKLLGTELPQGRFNQVPRVEISYEANQGNFKGSLPGHEVFFMEEESTVENLSMLFARLIKEKVSANDRVMVRAYEGVAKGAISTL